MNIRNIYDLEAKKWNGGVTREIYKDQENYNIRLSSAEIEPGESKFSDFTGYERILKVLEGEVRIKNGEEQLELDTADLYEFSGSDDVQSQNSDKVIDFNIIFKSDNIELSYLEVDGSEDFMVLQNALILALENSTAEVNEKMEFKKYDYLLIEDGINIALTGKFIVVLWEVL